MDPEFASLRDELVHLWERYGHRAARAALLASLPAELPPAVVRAERDRRIRQMAAALRHRYSARRVAAILCELGTAAEAGRPPQVTIDPSIASEINAARREIQRMLKWLPVRACGRRWLAERQLFALCNFHL